MKISKVIILLTFFFTFCSYAQDLKEISYYTYGGKCEFKHDSVLGFTRKMIIEQPDISGSYIIRVKRNKEENRKNRWNNIESEHLYQNSKLKKEVYFNVHATKYLQIEYTPDGHIILTDYFDDESVKMIRVYRNSTKNGTLEVFNSNGSQKLIYELENGVKTNFTIWNEDKIVSAQSSFVDGMGWCFYYDSRANRKVAVFVENYKIKMVDYYSGNFLFMRKEGEFTDKFENLHLMNYQFSPDMTSGKTIYYDNNGRILGESEISR